MTTIKKIKAPIEQELHDFEPYFKKSLQSDIPLLATVFKLPLSHQRQATSPHVSCSYRQNCTVEPMNRRNWRPVRLNYCTPPRWYTTMLLTSRTNAVDRFR